jgi:hypothetical protein
VYEEPVVRCCMDVLKPSLYFDPHGHLLVTSQFVEMGVCPAVSPLYRLSFIDHFFAHHCSVSSPFQTFYQLFGIVVECGLLLGMENTNFGGKRGKVFVLNELSTTPRRHMGEWMYRSTFC